MTRRRLVALVSACVLLTIGLVVIATGLVVTRTPYGQDQVRRWIVGEVNRNIHGKVYLGPIGGGFLTGLTIDTVAIRDENDSLFLSTGRVALTYDPRDLIDKRLFIRTAYVEHPVVHISQRENGEWNFKRIFPPGRPNLPKAPGRTFGNYVVIDSAHVVNGSFALSLPWHPDDTLHGAKRDSAVRYNLTRKDREFRRSGDGYIHTWRWTKGYAFASHLRLADPDSDKIGQSFLVDTLAVSEQDPPFDFRNVRATVRHLGDSLWLSVAHFDLPGSTGSGHGKIVWGGEQPVRYDIAVRGDSVSLRDVDWVYPTLPTTGGGSVLLQIRNERDPRIIDYKLTHMDMRSTGSHLRGDMTFGVGAPILAVRDVRIDADPIDWDLLRTLNGKRFPEDWRGQITGSVRAPGGPLNRFVVDAATATWRDAHVPGAVSRFGGKGELNILDPATTAFHHFAADVPSLDLRSIEYLFPSFPRLGGTVSGTALLDSSWLDVRIADANIIHQDGAGDPSRLAGEGRITWGDRYLTYDLTLDARPLSLGMLARSYPSIPFTGLVHGPIRAKGTIKDLELTAALQGPAGAFGFDGRIDLDPPGYAAHGAGTFTNLDVRQLLARSSVPVGTFTGRYDVQLTGDSIANLQGTAGLTLSRSEFDGLRIYPSMARVRFGDGRMRLDSVRIETTGATLTATGALGLPHGVSDSVHFAVNVDSLGGLRRYVATLAPDSGSAPDSLSGTLDAEGVAKGRIDSLDLTGWVSASHLYARNDGAGSAYATFALRNLPHNPSGTLGLRLDSVLVAGLDVDSLGASLRMIDPDHSTFTVAALEDAASASASGDVQLSAAGSRLTLQSVSILTDSAHRDLAWHLAAPAHLSRSGNALLLDSLVLRRGTTARIALHADIPTAAPVVVDLHADSVPLADLGSLVQLQTVLGGTGSVEGHIRGTRARPEITINAQATDFRFGGMHFERVTSTGSYQGRRFDAAMDLSRNGASAVRATASLPMSLSLFGAHLLDDSLRGTIRADSADLAVLEALSPALQHASGKLFVAVNIGGTWHHKTASGRMLLSNGDVTLANAGIRVRGIQGDLMLSPNGDTIEVRRFTGWSGAGPADSISLRGVIAFANVQNPVLGLRLDAHSFHALDRRSLAMLDMSTGPEGLELVGPKSGATLTGTVTVDRGVIYIPDSDLSRKQVVDLSGDDVYALIDSSDIRDRALVPDAPSDLVEHLRLNAVRINLGDEVRLRSREANIKLGGSLNVTRAPDDVRATRTLFGRGNHLARAENPAFRLALEGTLSADGGTYTLDLGVVQRDFEVKGGTITFLGTADNNPQLDISAQYNVTQAGRPDIGVIVHLRGPLNPAPTIDFASTENYEISQSDLVSYLVSGQPAVDNVNDPTKAAVSALVPTASTLLAHTLGEKIGSWVDLLQIQGGAPTTLQSGDKQQYNAQNFFYGARVGAEKQIRNNLSFSFSAGLCSLDLRPDNTSGFSDALGGKLVYRFKPTLSLQAGSEPATSALYCGKGLASVPGLIATPRQWGLSLLRTWRF